MNSDLSKLLRIESTRISYVFLVVAAIIAPIPMIISLLIYFVSSKIFRRVSSRYFFLGILCLLFGFSAMSGCSLVQALLSPLYIIINSYHYGTPLVFNTYFLGTEYLLMEITLWFLGRNIWNYVIAVVAVLISSLLHVSSEDILLAKTRKKQKQLLKVKQNVLDLNSKAHAFIIGTTGAGKTTLILKYVKKAFEQNQFIFILDGKADLDQYGLLFATRKLAERYDRRVWVINQADMKDTDTYNPFSDLTPTQIKDYLMAIGGPWTEEHFKALAARYWQMMAILMQRFGEPIDFNSILKYSIPDNLIVFLQSKRIKEAISKDEYDEYLRVIRSEAGAQAEVASNRIAVIFEGDGRQLFDTKNGNVFNLRESYVNNDVVICLNSKFSHADFAQSLADFVLTELKILVGMKLSHKIHSSGNETRSLFIFDELSSFVTEDFNYFLSQSRSANVKCLLATQLVQDIDRVASGLANQLMGNCKEFLILQTTDPDSAEIIAKYVGTEETVDQMDKSEGASLSGKTSNRIVETYKLPPKLIKELKPKYGFFYNTDIKDRIDCFKLDHIDLESHSKQADVELKQDKPNVRYEGSDIKKAVYCIRNEDFRYQVMYGKPALDDDAIKGKAYETVKNGWLQEKLSLDSKVYRPVRELYTLFKRFDFPLISYEDIYPVAIGEGIFYLEHTEFNWSRSIDNKKKIELLKEINAIDGLSIGTDPKHPDFPVIFFEKAYKEWRDNITNKSSESRDLTNHVCSTN